MSNEIQFTIKGLIIDPNSNSPIVILQDMAETTILPIWIGIFEANAIALELEHIEPPRPMTHDLIRNLLKEMGVTLEKIVVTELKDNTYYAQLRMLKGTESLVMDARPSDAMALAVRMKASIWVDEDVIRVSRSFSLTDKEDWSPEDLQRWLEELGPDDLGKYKM